MNNKEKKWRELARYLAGEMNMQEEVAYRSRIEKNHQRISELKAMEQTWKRYHAGTSGTDRNTGEAWMRLHKRLREDGLLDEVPMDSGRRNLMPLLRVAAVILLAIAIGGPALYFGVVRNHESASIEHQRAAQGVSTVDLPDGSRIYLNEGAEISYPSAFERDRSVTLRGEAFFEVMSDPGNPFMVSSGKVVVSVLGTSFNVKHSGRSEGVEVYVERGRVRMSMARSGQFLNLEPGEVGTVEGSGLTRSVQEDPNYISWKTKDFKFVNVELDRVIRKLEEAYHVEIRAEEGIDLNNLRLTSTYREQSIDAILETIATAFGMAVHKEKNTYYLTRN
jgi:transmembrane sensor